MPILTYGPTHLSTSEKRFLEKCEISPSHHHGVEHDPQTPHVRGPPGVAGVAPQDLGADVGGTPVLVGEEVVGLVLEDDGVFKRL